jgi:hypothetical protein
MWTVFTTVEENRRTHLERSRHMVKNIAIRAAGFVGVLTVSFG